MLSKVFCFRLETAGLIVGWLGMMASFLTTIFLGFLHDQSAKYAYQILDNSRNSNMSFEFAHTVFIIAVGLFFAIAVLNLFASGLLVLGTLMESHLMLLPCLFLHGLNLKLSIFYFISLWLRVQFPTTFIEIIISTLVLALEIYIYYGIYSLYKQIRSSNKKPLQPNNMQIVGVVH